MAKYEIKDAKTANLEEIYFDKNVKKMCYKNAYGIITELEYTPVPQVNPTNQYMPLNVNGAFGDSPLFAVEAQSGYFGWPTLRTKVGALISTPTGVNQTNIASYLPEYGFSIFNNPVIGQQVSLGSYQGAGQLYFSVIGDYPISSFVENSLYLNPIVGGANSAFLVKANGSRVQIGTQYNYNVSNIYNGILALEDVGSLILNAGIASPDLGVIRASAGIGRIEIGTNSDRSIGIDMINASVLVGANLHSTPPTNTTNPVRWVKVTDEAGVVYKLPLYQ